MNLFEYYLCWSWAGYLLIQLHLLVSTWINYKQHDVYSGFIKKGKEVFLWGAQVEGKQNFLFLPSFCKSELLWERKDWHGIEWALGDSVWTGSPVSWSCMTALNYANYVCACTQCSCLTIYGSKQNYSLLIILSSLTISLLSWIMTWRHEYIGFTERKLS